MTCRGILSARLAMFAKIYRAQEEKRWAVADSVPDPAEALPYADAALERLWRAKKLKAPGAQADAVMERNILRPKTRARRGLRLLACARSLTLEAAHRHGRSVRGRGIIKVIRKKWLHCGHYFGIHGRCRRMVKINYLGVHVYYYTVILVLQTVKIV